MNNQSDLDKELADMTDNLMAGKLSDVSPDNEAYAKLVKQLYQAVGANSTPDAAFRARLTQRLNQEWTATFQKQPKRFVMPRYAYALAAGLAAILILVLAVSSLSSQVTPQVGTSIGGNPVVPIVVGVIGIVVVAGLLIFWRRK